jgi:hypothetical protein
MEEVKCSTCVQIFSCCEEYLQYLLNKVIHKIIVFEIKKIVLSGAYVCEVCSGFENNNAEGKS